MNDIHATFRREGLVRPTEGRVLGGVFAGLGRRFGLDPWPSRVVFIVLMLAVPGSQILLYPLFWVLMPDEARDGAPAGPTGPLAPSGPVVPTAA